MQISDNFASKTLARGKTFINERGIPVDPQHMVGKSSTLMCPPPPHAKKKKNG